MEIYKTPAQSLNRWKREAMIKGYIPPTNKTGDIENIEKGVMDACTGIIYHDDCQVFSSHCEMRYSERARVEVTIHAYFTDLGEVRELCLNEIYSSPRPYRCKDKKEV